MARKAVYLGVFVAAFLIGLAVALPFLTTFEVILVEEIDEVDITTACFIREALTTKTPPEKVEWKQEDETNFKIKLLETGEGFHGDEITARSGETWLGLFKNRDGYQLRNTKLKVTRAHDPIVDYDDTIETGKSVFTEPGGTVVFLLRNAKTIRKGPVDTVFYADDFSEQTELKNNTQKEFRYNGHHYALKVENHLTSDEYLTKGSMLVLAKDGQEQVLNYLEDGCNDCSWNVFWVGDLDRDGELDFYFDLSGHYNVVDKRLFLSSQARKGQIIRNVASFAISGC